MQGIKLSESKILRKILSKNSSETKQETTSLNQASENSTRQFYHQNKKYEII